MLVTKINRTQAGAVSYFIFQRPDFGFLGTQAGSPTECFSRILSGVSVSDGCARGLGSFSGFLPIIINRGHSAKSSLQSSSELPSSVRSPADNTDLSHLQELQGTTLVEKTDRLYRNFRDCVTLENLDVEIHLPKEGQIISKDSKSQASSFTAFSLSSQETISRTCATSAQRHAREGCARHLPEPDHRSVIKTSCCARLRLTRTTRRSRNECSNYTQRVRTRSPPCVCFLKPSTRSFRSGT
jgi:hypothetical protein